MRFHKELYLVILGIFLYFTLVLNERRELEGYKFPVYSTPFCPRNESEWNKRSTALNCNKTNGYTCLPNQKLTELLEFCYTEPRIMIEEGTCLYLVKSVSQVNGRSCKNFTDGCHNTSFISDRIYEYPACISLGNGCFLAEPPCKSDNFSNFHENGSINIKEDSTITHIYPQQSTEQTHAGNPSTNDKEKAVLTGILLGIIPISICVLFVLCSYYVFHKRKFQICKRHGDIESSEVEQLAQSTEQHEVNLIDTIDTEFSFFKQKHAFESDEDEEMKPLIHESQHAEENSERHEVEMITTCQNHSVRNRNGKESLTEEIVTHSFENNQLINTVPTKIPAPLKEESVIHRRDSSLESVSEEHNLNPLINEQHADGNAENNDGKMLTLPMEENKDTTYQEYQECTRNGEEGLNVLTPTQYFENYQLDTALIEEACCTYKRKSAIGGNEDEKVKPFFDHNQLIGRHAENHEGEMLNKNKNMICQESSIEEAIFNEWNQEDSSFIFTKACEEVEKLVKNKNLVIVAGQSGSGKSAIIKHIALQYRKRGWKVKRVKEVKDIVDECCSGQFKRNETICIFNDPIGKESFDEMLNNSWQTYEEELKSYFKTSKLMVSCRSYIVSDTRLTRYLVNQADIVYIDNDENKLSISEKRQILTKYTSDMNLSDNECDQIVKVEQYFPLLCNLYSKICDSNKHDIGFFTEPRKVFEEDVREFRKKDKKKYCALVLLVLFNNDLCPSYLLKNKEIETKYKHTLKLYGLPEYTPPSEIRDTLESLKGFFVKKIGDTYHFHHDFVMEVTTHVFGTDYPADIIYYADIDLLRRTVRVENCNEKNDTFTINLTDRYVEEYANRLFSEMIGPRFLDVVLNPCLRNEKVIKALRQNIDKDPKQLKLILKNTKLKTNTDRLNRTSKDLLLSKLSFLELQMEVSPLFALIVFCHTELATHCLNTLQQNQTNIHHCSLFPAVCCNGSLSMFETFSKDSMTIIWHDVHPIHIVSLFHNYEILEKLIEKGENVNQKIDAYRSWTPLMLASGNDCQENEINNHGISSETRRNKTVEVLLKNGADINISCIVHGDGPLFLACQNGYESTVNLLLRKRPNVNACTNDGSSPLYIACQNGHDGTVLLLLSNGADINLCKENGTSPLLIACENGHDSTVQVLLSNGADINLCTVDGASPLYTACLNGHDASAKLLLSYGADIDMCIKDEFGPLFGACLRGHESTVKLLLRNGAKLNLCRNGLYSPFNGACFSGQENIFNILLRNGADINLCIENGDSPLYSACLLGHDNTVKFLVSNGAIVNLCKKNGISPLSAACFVGHDSTVQFLLNNKADINLCSEHGTSPLYTACNEGHCSTVQLLLSNGADISLCCIDGFGPLFAACTKGYNNIVQLLLSNRADINFCSKDNSSPLYAACQNGHYITAQLLLSNGADINLCKNNNRSPLYAACCNGHFDIVQLLLNEGADINLCSEDGASPLYAACIKGHDSIVQFLLNKEANVNLCKMDGTSPLIAASFTGHDSNIQQLLNNRANVNLCNNNGIYPLHLACLNSQKSTVQLLVDNQGDVNLCMKNGISPLHVACETGNVGIVELLITKEADINVRSEDGTSPLLAACLSKQYYIIQLLLRHGGDTNLCMKNGTSPLYVACCNGRKKTAQLLLNKGAQINSCINDGSSPLFVACLKGYYRTVQLLLDNGADNNLCNKHGHGPLYAACFSGHYETAQLLLNNGTDINEGMATGKSLLHLACCVGNDAVVQFLLRNEAKINLCKESKESPICSDCYRRHDSIPSPLYGACLNGKYSTVQLLINMKADINLCLEDGISPLFAACKAKNDSIVQLLLSNGADVNLSRRDGCSPLHEACKTGHDSTVELLLTNGANVNLYTKCEVSPLFIASFNGYDRIVKLLINKGADLNLCREGAPNPLFAACENGHKSIVQLLLSYRADINLCREDGAIPLCIACHKGHEIIVQLLLSNKAEVNLCMKCGTSPLFIACQNGHDTIVQLLLKNGADVNLCKNVGASPIYVACQNGHDSTVQLLLSNGADINLYLEDESSPLYIACQNGHIGAVKILLTNGADINSCLTNGMSPLYTACYNGHDDIVQLLLRDGADINLCMNDGVSPLYIAFECRFSKIVDILLNNGVVDSLDCGWEVNPDLVDCFDENDSTVKFLRQPDNVLCNMYDLDSYFSLFVGCQVERVTRMIFDI
ncbi:uncharacterized protein LOC128182140 [Crassostrea angulata]|uniref:uncharacterized protein LOC128182140 n=1 Tax=Magallana angulata TaxID=2784310 RepID=UPI0022B1900B|nr:uncharacterized protein LOC128182140 [Crassostrea angulata]